MQDDNSKAAEDIFPPKMVPPGMPGGSPKKNGFEKFGDAVAGFCGPNGGQGPGGCEGEKEADSVQTSAMRFAVLEIQQIARQLAGGERPTLEHTRMAVDVWKQVRSDVRYTDPLLLLTGRGLPKGNNENAVPPMRSTMRAARMPMGGATEDKVSMSCTAEAGSDVKLTDYIRQSFSKLSRGEKSVLLNALNRDFVEQDGGATDESPGPIEVRSGDRIPPNRG
jgi:hypothetical protein